MVLSVLGNFKGDRLSFRGVYISWGFQEIFKGCEGNFMVFRLFKGCLFLSSANKVSTGPTCQFLSVCVCVCLCVFPVFYSRRLIG